MKKGKNKVRKNGDIINHEVFEKVLTVGKRANKIFKNKAFYNKVEAVFHCWFARKNLIVFFSLWLIVGFQKVLNNKRLEQKLE